MKHYLFILFFLPGILNAQETPDSTVTTYENRTGTFFSITRSFFPNGRILTDEQPLGTDTTAVANAILAPVFSVATQYAEKAATSARLARTRQQINGASSALQSLTGLDYYDFTNRLLIDEFLPIDEQGQSGQSVNYTIRVDGTPILVTFRRNTSGQLVMNQGATNFRVDIVSRNWLRIRRYQGTEIPTATGWIDLFQEKNGNYISSDLKYQLRR